MTMTDRSGRPSNCLRQFKEGGQVSNPGPIEEPKEEENKGLGKNCVLHGFDKMFPCNEKSLN